MPNLDGTGPQGRGPRTAGRKFNRPLGSNVCKCPNCQHQVPHSRGRACSQLLCSKCGTAMQGINCYNPA